MGVNNNIMKKIKIALLSLSNKNNLKNILKVLRRFKIKIISSGGTHKEIKKLGFECTEISKFTNSPEILDGRVKTLHPKIHAGILSKRKNKSHQLQLKKNNYENIDLVIVNFYPFEKTLNTTKNHSNIERVNRLNAGIYMYQDHPSFGLGMGTFPEKYLDFVNYHPEMIKVAERTYDLMNSHNLFLTWLVEGGLITFLSGVGVVLFALFWLISEYRKKNSFLKLLLIAYLVGFIFHGFFHDFGQNARIIIPFWVCLAIVSRQLVQRKTIDSKA